VFCAVCAGWDTAEATLEERVRDCLGARADEFDLVMGVEKALEPAELARQLVRPGFRGDRGSADRWAARFREAGLVSHVYGALALARRGGAGAPGTERTWLGRATCGADLERVLVALGERRSRQTERARGPGA